MREKALIPRVIMAASVVFSLSSCAKNGIVTANAEIPCRVEESQFIQREMIFEVAFEGDCKSMTVVFQGRGWKDEVRQEEFNVRRDTMRIPLIHPLLGLVDSISISEENSGTIFEWERDSTKVRG